MALGNYSLSNATSTVTAIAAFTPSPLLKVSGSTSYGESVAALQVTYAFEILGSSGQSFVPVRVVANGGYTFSQTGNAFADTFEAILQIDGPQVSFAKTADINSASSWSLNNIYQFEPNQVYYVTMQAGGAATSGILGGTASFSTYVDPIFTIDPAFQDASSYSLVFSDGIGNSAVSAVPEPSTLGNDDPWLPRSWLCRIPKTPPTRRVGGVLRV